MTDYTRIADDMPPEGETVLLKWYANEAAKKVTYSDGSWYVGVMAWMVHPTDEWRPIGEMPCM